MKITLHNDEGQEFVYEWNGSLTVNVSTRAVTGELVNFDVFTLGEETEASEILKHCQEWHEYATEADYRYTEELPREVLLYG